MQAPLRRPSSRPSWPLQQDPCRGRGRLCPLRLRRAGRLVFRARRPICRLWPPPPQSRPQSPQADRATPRSVRGRRRLPVAGPVPARRWRRVLPARHRRPDPRRPRCPPARRSGRLPQPLRRLPPPLRQPPRLQRPPEPPRLPLPLPSRLKGPLSPRPRPRLQSRGWQTASQSASGFPAAFQASAPLP